MRQFLGFMAIAGMIMTGIASLNTAHAQPGDALDFDGTDDYVKVLDNPALQQATFTLEAWFNIPNSLSTSSDILVIASRQDSSAAKPYHKRNFWLVVDNGSQNGSVVFKVGDGFANPFTLTTDDAPNNGKDYRDGNWHHAAAIVNAGSNSAELFVDGESQSTYNSSFSVYNRSGDVTIARGVGNASRSFEGIIDEVRFWSVARTQTQIRDYMHQEISNPANFSDLVGYWRMNDGSGQTATDETSNSNDGRLGSTNASDTLDPSWVTSEAVLTDASTQLTSGNTFSDNLAAIWNANTTASSGGLEITPNSSNTLSISDDLIFGHDGSSGQNTTNNANYTQGSSYSGPTTVESRLNREWFIDDNAAGKTVDFTVTTNYAGTADFGSYSLASDFVLIEVQSSGNDIIVQSGDSASSGTNSTITFTNVDVNSTYTFGTTNQSGSPLPVELTSFDVQKVESSAFLNWATASKTNNSHFLVQQRAGDKWNILGKVRGHGTTIAPQEYRFTDEQPQQGTNYYRLKQVDYDGSFEYSNVKALQFGEAVRQQRLQVKLLSNPVDQALNLELSSEQGGRCQYQLYTAQGSTVKQGVWQLAKGQQSQNLSMHGLPTGTYLLRIAGAHQQVTKKVMKQ